MSEIWTGEIVGKLHVNDITRKELAAKMGVHEKYLSAILNGHKTPSGVEDRVRAALDELLAERETNE